MYIFSSCTNLYNQRKDGHFSSDRDPTLSEKIQSLVPKMFDDEEVFCAGDSIDTNSACNGDSGGPVFKFVSSIDRNSHYQLVGNFQN